MKGVTGVIAAAPGSWTLFTLDAGRLDDLPPLLGGLGGGSPLPLVHKWMPITTWQFGDWLRAQGGLAMSLVSLKELLVVAAVLDVAEHADRKPIAARALAHHLKISPRYLEPLLQTPARRGVLKSIRGSRGGYRLAREPNQITADAILRAVRNSEDEEDSAAMKSPLVSQVVVPHLASAEVAFSMALARITVAGLMRMAKMIQRPAA
jgi:Rrf2 family protein